jgi:hypothetical protein
MMAAMKKHLAELNYPTPRTVSKLADQVRYLFGHCFIHLLRMFIQVFLF